MSRTRFSRIFKQVTGTTFARYVLDCRLDGAWRDLLAGDDKLAYIAEKWGFAHPGHLSQSFKSRFGVSPLALRQRMLGGAEDRR
jgi:AraC-like DNA-binding protein